jgi:hypothetical protein
MCQVFAFTLLNILFLVSLFITGRVHNDVVDAITRHIRQDRSRIAVVVTGMPLAGKKIICQRAAGCSNLVPYLHLSDASAGFLQLANTLATWFRYVDDEDIRRRAEIVLELMKKQHWSRSHDECIDLVDMALSKGLQACFLIDRIQFLDEFSFSLLRECLSDRIINRRGSRRISGFSRHRLSSLESNGPDLKNEKIVGKVCFLCVHVSFYNWKSANDVVNDISRSHDPNLIPIVRVAEAKKEELVTMFRDLSDMEVEDRWLDAYVEATGGSAGYFIERAAAIRTISSKLWSEGKRSYAETTEKLVLHIPYGNVRKNKTLPVVQVSAEVAMRFNQIFDELPPLFQTTLKVLTMALRTGFAYKLPRMVLWEVLNDLVADGVELDVLTIIVSEMVDMYIVKIENNGVENVLSFKCPAFADVAYDLSTPVQIQSIAEALVERLQPRLKDNFKVPLVLASLHHIMGRTDTDSKRLWIEGYELFLSESMAWAEKEINKWKECIDDEIASTGCTSCDILGDRFFLDKPTIKVVGKILPLLKVR